MSNFPHIEQLLKRIEALEAHVRDLDARFERLAKNSLGCLDGVELQVKLVRRDLTFLFERVRHVEHTLFPNLAGDLDNLGSVLGIDPEEGPDPSPKPKT